MYQKKTRGIRPWMAGVAVLAVVVWLFYALGNILTPFIVAAVLAYILNPLVEKLRDKGMKRGLAAMLVMIFSLVLILALTLVIVPMLVNQFNNMVRGCRKLWILCKTKCCRGSICCWAAISRSTRLLLWRGCNRTPARCAMLCKESCPR